METLEPTHREERTWTCATFAIMWFSVSVNPGGYEIGAGLADLGLSFWRGLLSVFVGSAILVVPLVMNAVAGEKYGIPFPVYCRAAFGSVGHHGAVLTRGAVAILWLSFQKWSAACVVSAAAFDGNHDIAVFLALAGLHIACILWGVKHFKHVLYACCPVVVAGTLYAVCWARAQASWSTIHETYDTEANERRGSLGAGANAVVATWSTMVLNVADVSRFAESPNAQRLGQPLGSFAAFAWIAFVGMVCSAVVKYRTQDEDWPWEVADLLAEWPRPTRVAAAIVVSASVLSVNLVVNVLSPANDLLNVAPRIFTFKCCAIFSVVCAVAARPWKLFASARSYLRTFLDGYSAATGAIAAVMLVDFWLVRGRQLDLKGLYEPHGPYTYSRGHNPRAIVAIAAALAPCLPGLLGDDRAWAQNVHDMSWFVAFSVAALVYFVLARLFPPQQSIWSTDRHFDRLYDDRFFLPPSPDHPDATRIELSAVAGLDDDDHFTVVPNPLLAASSVDNLLTISPSASRVALPHNHASPPPPPPPSGTPGFLLDDRRCGEVTPGGRDAAKQRVHSKPWGVSKQLF